MPKNQDALDNFKKRQKVVDEMQVEELKRQQEKDKEHDEELTRQRSVDELHDDKIANLEAEHKETKADISQLKSDLDSAIEAIQKVEKSKGNDKKDKEQDNRIGKVEVNLLGEALRIKNLYETFEEETKKIADLYDEIYSLKQRNISQSHTDNLQDIDTKDLQDRLRENKVNDAEKAADISRNKLHISDNFKYIQSVDKRLKGNKKFDKWTMFIAVISLLGVIGLYAMEFLK